MKRTYYYAIYFLSCCIFTSSCDFDDPAFIEPVSSFSLNKSDVEVFEILTLTNEGQGQFYAVFTGDAGHRFSRRDSGDVGFKTDVNGNFTYSYAEAGTYTLTFVATGYRLETGEKVEKISEATITVTDPDISSIEMTRFEIVNSAVNNNKFLDPITFLFKDYRKTADTIDQENLKIGISFYRPTRMGEIRGGGFNSFQLPADINIIPDIQLSIPSRTVQLEIDGTDAFVSGQTRIIHDTEDDLRFQEKSYTIVNQQGQRKSYTVCPMIIPEFSSFSVEGQSGLLNLSAGAYTEFFVQIDVPDGTDVSNISPEWSLLDAENIEVFVNGELQTSGQSPQDFTNPVIYTLVYSQPKDVNDTYDGVFVSRSQV
ncbi:MAG: hypothetical protein AAFR59_18275, partial [Bacteroidota bacterium]